ncbi:MAG: hypothetical protein ACLTKI_06515 [Lachnospiraceae bacterium]
MIQGIRFRRLLPRTYVITPAINGNNILDLFPAMVFRQPYYQKKDLLVLGIADDYWEALEVARQIVDDLYQTTGGFNLAVFLEQEYKAGET